MSTLELRIDRADEAPGELTPGERLAAALAWAAVRLWCLPWLLLAWALGWAAIGAIRGVGAAARVGRAARARGAAAGPHRPVGRTAAGRS
jgi:hypothetical protein